MDTPLVVMVLDAYGPSRNSLSLRLYGASLPWEVSPRLVACRRGRSALESSIALKHPLLAYVPFIAERRLSVHELCFGSYFGSRGVVKTHVELLRPLYIITLKIFMKSHHEFSKRLSVKIIHELALGVNRANVPVAVELTNRRMTGLLELCSLALLTPSIQWR